MTTTPEWKPVIRPCQTCGCRPLVETVVDWLRAAPNAHVDRQEVLTFCEAILARMDASEKGQR